MSKIPLTLPWKNGLSIKATSIELTKHGAEITYKLPFENHSVVLRPRTIEQEFSKRDKTPRQPIVQQGKWECMAAAIAMCTGHTMFQVKRAMGRNGWRNDNGGAPWEASRLAVQSLGFDLLWLPKKKVYMLDDVPTAILTVDSLNYSGRAHAVSWVDGEVLDPNNGFEGRYSWGPDWHPHTIGMSGAEILLKPVTRIQYEDLVTMQLIEHEDLQAAIAHHAA